MGAGQVGAETGGEAAETNGDAAGVEELMLAAKRSAMLDETRVVVVASRRWASRDSERSNLRSMC